ncbi:glycosyltransferase 87 family protein [Streptacidiphilus rugosus]|uniref:glycosyltransferase 87 family protein n=1 Tax=Streptacidiphilus rugosus TaxID=405783 RepID=UPI0012F9D14F|nr:glycosyltransferase 87 family protein [Streptacidiphilus rugosus]
MTTDKRGSSLVREARSVQDALRRTLREAPRRTTVLAGVASLLSLLAYVLLRHLVHVSMIDALVYQAEGSAVLHGHDLYQLRVVDGTASLPATYPPFAAMLFTPVALLSVGALRVVVTSVNLLQLVVVAYLSCKLADWPSRPLRPAAVMLVTGFSVWLEPVWTTLRYGQVNLLILGLVLYDLTLPDSRRRKGIAIGIAAGLKVTPGFFVVYLLLTRRYRAAAAAAAAGAGTVLLGMLALPGATWDFWTKELYDTTRVGKEFIVDNQSLRGMVDRMLGTTHSGVAATALVAVVVVAGLAAAVLIERRCGGMPRARAWSVVTVGVTMVLVSPISWTHHWVWCVPLLVLLGAEVSAERRRGVAGWRGRRWRALTAATGVVFCSFAMWMVPHRSWTVVNVAAYLQPLASVYGLFGLALLGFVLLRVRRWQLRSTPGGIPARERPRVGARG